MPLLTSNEEPEPFILPQAIGAIRSYLAYLQGHDPNHRLIETLERIIKRYEEKYGKDTTGSTS